MCYAVLICITLHAVTVWTVCVQALHQQTAPGTGLDSDSDGDEHEDCTGLLFVPIFPGQPQFYGFYRSLYRCPDKFGSGRQMSRFLPSHKIHFRQSILIFFHLTWQMGRRHVHFSVTKINKHFQLERDFRNFHYLSPHTATFHIAHGPCYIVAGNVCKCVVITVKVA
jgi:hypothetical protein